MVAVKFAIWMLLWNILGVDNAELVSERDVRLKEIRRILLKQLNLPDTPSPEDRTDEIPKEVFDEYRLINEIQGNVGEGDRDVVNEQDRSAQKVSSYKGSGVELHSKGDWLTKKSLLRRRYRLSFDFHFQTNHSISTVQLVLYQLPLSAEHQEWTEVQQSVEISKVVESNEKVLKMPIVTKMMTLGDQGYQVIDLTGGDLLWLRNSIDRDKRKLQLEVTVHFSGYATSRLGDDRNNSRNSPAIHIVPPGIEFALNDSYPKQTPRLVVMSPLLKSEPSRKKRYSVQDAYRERYCPMTERHCCVRNFTANFHTDLNLPNVLYPAFADFGYCHGYCPLYSELLETPPVYRYIAYRSPDIKPCCAMRQMADLVTIVKMGGVTKTVTFPNVRIFSCKCH